MNLRTIALVKLTIAIVGMFASLMTQTMFANSDHINVRVFLADWDGESGLYMGAIETSNGWMAIGFENETQGEKYEDDFEVDETQIGWVDLFTDGSLHFNANNKTFAFWYLGTDSVISEVKQATPTSVKEARINGALAQVTGNVVNGKATLLRDAGNPLSCTVYCRGTFVQNGNLVRFVYTVVEPEPNRYVVYMPIISR